MNRHEEYRRLREHMRYHNVRRWLLKGAQAEDANTIRRAIERLSDDELDRALARALVEGRRYG